LAGCSSTALEQALALARAQAAVRACIPDESAATESTV
jgi:predicted acyl esterase